MTTPDQPRTDQHGRGVRGAINDLLGRDDHTDDRRDVEGQLRDERSDARTDAGYDPRTDDAGYRDAGYQDPDVVPADGRQHLDGPGTAAGTPVQTQRQDQTPLDGPQYDSRNDNGQHADLGGPAGGRDVEIDGTGSPEAATTPVTPTPTGQGSVADTSQGEDSDGRERLVSTERAQSYGSRWDTVKGEFVDEPRKAVADADALVGELLDELQTLFTEQRRGIEHGLNTDETSTEDMRLALRRYRSFFDRLLSI